MYKKLKRVCLFILILLINSTVNNAPWVSDLSTRDMKIGPRIPAHVDMAMKFIAFVAAFITVGLCVTIRRALRPWAIKGFCQKNPNASPLKKFIASMMYL